MPILRATNIERGRINRNGLMFAELKDLPLERAPLLETGEVLVVRSGAYTGDSARVTDEWEGSAPGYDLRLTPRSIDSRFLSYQLLSRPVLDQIHLVKGRAAQPHLNAEDLGDVRIESFSKEVEHAIADFLDAETARIDRMIAIRRRQVSLLDERTEAMIADLLDPLIARQGEVPLKALADVRFSSVDKKTNQDEMPVLLCNYTDVYYNRTIDSAFAFMEATATPQEIARFTLRGGDVLLTKDSETPDDIGISSLVAAELPGVVLGYHLALVRPRAVDGRFLCWALRSRRCRDAFSVSASGVTRFGLRQDAVGRIPIPNLDRRTASNVVSGIENRVTAADAMGRQVRKQIDLLIERRQSLITAAVTGQLEIPGVAA